MYYMQSQGGGGGDGGGTVSVKMDADPEAQSEGGVEETPPPGGVYMVFILCFSVLLCGYLWVFALAEEWYVDGRRREAA